MNRVVGLETEYGCLVSSEERNNGPDVYPIRTKNHVFKIDQLGILDLHYRDYEEPPGNGGFLLNGGRMYLDMGHLEYSTPECLSLKDIVAFDAAGERMLQNALEEMQVHHKVSFLKNNIDHHTGATFGCHENYLMKREAQFTPPILAALLSFLATRQIFTGTGRVGQANPLPMENDRAGNQGMDFQISQRADHIVNDIYQWVQFNRAIINARDEPLADHRKYRRLHLLVGDSNMSQYANALKIGTTAMVLDLLEEGILPKRVALMDAVQSTRDISHDLSGRWLVRLETGQTRSAIEIQRAFLSIAQNYLNTGDEENNWILSEWERTLDSLEREPEELVGKVDWITKRYLLRTFVENEKLSWNDPWLQSLDLEYHNLDRDRGLFYGFSHEKYGNEVVSVQKVQESQKRPPATTRACGRGTAVKILMDKSQSYIINWDSIAIEGHERLDMSDPFQTYQNEVKSFIAASEKR